MTDHTRPDDPMERMIYDALEDADEMFVCNIPTRDTVLDFYLPVKDVYIEVKQFHSERIDRQLASANNIIVAQGRIAVEYLAKLIRGK